MFEAYIPITALIYLTLTLFNGLLKLIEKYMDEKEAYRF